MLEPFQIHLKMGDIIAKVHFYKNHTMVPRMAIRAVFFWCVYINLKYPLHTTKVSKSLFLL